MNVMKNRDYKNFAQGNYYHVYNRGNAKETIFQDNADYLLFLSRLKENLFPSADYEAGNPRRRKHGTARSRRIQTPPNSFSLGCYCLMPNHFHFLIKQCTELPIGRLISKIGTGYSKCFNQKYERVGNVFQDAFKAISVEKNDYLTWLSVYIHANPVVAGLVKHPADWPWSSYKEFIFALNMRGILGSPAVLGLCETEIITNQFTTAAEYEKLVLESAELIREKKEMESLWID